MLSWRSSLWGAGERNLLHLRLIVRIDHICQIKSIHQLHRCSTSIILPHIVCIEAIQDLLALLLLLHVIYLREARLRVRELPHIVTMG